MVSESFKGEWDPKGASWNLRGLQKVSNSVWGLMRFQNTFGLSQSAPEEFQGSYSVVLREFQESSRRLSGSLKVSQGFRGFRKPQKRSSDSHGVPRGLRMKVAWDSRRIFTGFQECVRVIAGFSLDVFMGVLGT